MSTQLQTIDKTNVKIRWKEEYVSEGLNAKFFGLIPKGIQRGGHLRAAGAGNGLNFYIDPDPDFEDTIVTYSAQVSGLQTSIRLDGIVGPISVSGLANQTIYITVYVDYTTGAETAAEIRAYTDAEWSGLSADEKNSVAVLGKIVVPAAGDLESNDVFPEARTEAWMTRPAGQVSWVPILRNGSFETGEASYWETGSGADGADWYVSDNYSYDSKGKYYLATNDDTADRIIRQEVNFPVIPTQKILVRTAFYAPYTGLGNADLIVRLLYEDTLGAGVTETFVALTQDCNGSGWVFQEKVVEVPASRSNLKYVQLFKDGTVASDSGFDCVQVFVEDMLNSHHINPPGDQYDGRKIWSVANSPDAGFSFFSLEKSGNQTTAQLALDEQGVTNAALVTTTDVTLGNTTNRWPEGWFTKLDVSDTLDEGVAGHLVPTDNNQFDLGNTSRKWRTGRFSDDLHVDDVVYAGSIETNGNVVIDGILTVNEEILPDVNDGASIGRTAERFSTVFMSTGNMTYLTLSSTTDEGVTGHLVPTDDDQYDLGTATRQWRNAYFDGIVNVDSLDVDIITLSTGASQGFDSDVLPASGTLTLGDTGREWQHVYVSGFVTAGTLSADNIQLAVGAGQGFETDVYPDSQDARSLGANNRQWSVCWTGELGYRMFSETAGTNEAEWWMWVDSGGANELFKLTSRTQGIGEWDFLTAKRQADAIITEEVTLKAGQKVILEGPTTEVTGHLLPDAADNDLGASGNKWHRFFLSDADDDGVAGNLVPTGTDFYDLGSPTRYWAKLYLTSSAGNGIEGNLAPATSMAYTIGTSGYGWEGLYMRTNNAGSEPMIEMLYQATSDARPFFYGEIVGASNWTASGGFELWAKGDIDYSTHGSHYYFMNPTAAKTVSLFGFYDGSGVRVSVIDGFRSSADYWRDITVRLAGHATDGGAVGYLELDDGSEAIPPALVLTNHSPAASDAGPRVGSIYMDASYLYVYTASNTWKRVALTGGY